jgi:hypothetical protein
MPPDEPPAARRRALLIATATYGDPGLAALRAPTGDVAGLAQVLGDDAIGGFDVQQLIDQPTEQLRKEIETFFGDGRPQDLLLLYVSGHGVLSQSRRFYFATTSTSLQLLRSTAVEDSFVNDVMQASRSRSIVLVLDCCHSGAFGKGLAPKSAMTVDVEHRFDGQGRVTLSASTELEYAFEEAGPSGINELDPAAPGSLFTRSVVEGLQSGDADVDEDGRISVDDLYDYVCRRVRARSVHQTPGMAGDIRGEIVIARSRRRAELPPELARAVASNMAGIRAGAVDELKGLLSAGGTEAAAARAALERLAEDDSRRVATAALTALGRPPLPPAPPPPRPPARPWRRPPRRVLLGAIVAVVAVAAALVILLPGGGSESSGPSEATAYDFDGDGLQEIVAAPLSASTAEVLVTSPVADFQPRSISAAEARVDVGPRQSFGTAIASGDFTGDGKADLAIGTPDLNTVSVLYGSGDVGFPHVVALKGPETSRFGQALLARDLNDDHRTDLVVGAAGANKDPGSIRILLGGPGDLTLKSARELKPPPGVTDNFGAILRSGDLNGDGNVDLVEGAPDDNGQHLTYCLGSAQAPPTRCTMLKAPDGDTGTSALAVADLNNDDKDDIVQSDTHLGGAEHGGGLRIWRGHEGVPEGTPQIVKPDDVITSHGMGAPSSRFGAALDAGLLDSDEFADIVVGAPGFNGEGEGAVALIRGDQNSIARNKQEPSEEHLGFGADVALLELQSSDRPNVVVVSEGALAGGVVRYFDTESDSIKSVAGFDKLVRNRKQAKDLHIGHSAGAD